MKELRLLQKILLAGAGLALVCGFVWAFRHGAERAPLTFVFFGLGLTLLASVARSISTKTELSEKQETLQVSKV